MDMASYFSKVEWREMGMIYFEYVGERGGREGVRLGMTSPQLYCFLKQERDAENKSVFHRNRENNTK